MQLPDFQFFYYMAATVPRLYVLYSEVMVALLAALLAVAHAARNKILTKKEFLRKASRIGIAGIILATVTALTPPKETWIGMYNNDPVIQSVLQQQKQAQQEAEVFEQAEKVQTAAIVTLEKQ